MRPPWSLFWSTCPRGHTNTSLEQLYSTHLCVSISGAFHFNMRNCRQARFADELIERIHVRIDDLAQSSQQSVQASRQFLEDLPRLSCRCGIAAGNHPGE